MTEYQAHDMLARALGDPFAPVAGNPAAIPDGVRYSAATRANYINRARLSILEQAAKGVSVPVAPGNSVPPISTQSAIVAMTFPRLFKHLQSVSTHSPISSLPIVVHGQNEYNSSDAINTAVVYMVHSIETWPARVPIPLVESYQASRLINPKNPQRPDPLAYIEGDPFAMYRISVYWGTDTPSSFRVHYTRYPAALTGTGTALVDWEPMFDHLMISKATIYGQYDSQEFGVPEQILPILLQ